MPGAVCAAVMVELSEILWALIIIDDFGRMICQEPLPVAVLNDVWDNLAAIAVGEAACFPLPVGWIVEEEDDYSLVVPKRSRLGSPCKGHFLASDCV